MRLLIVLPLPIIPLIAYNLVFFGIFGSTTSNTWQLEIMSLTMVSGAQFRLLLGDLLMIIALAFLFIEIIKATNTGNSSLIDHILSMFVFMIYLVEFLAVQEAATSLFLILTVISFLDVIAGFSITISGARRDMALDQPRLS